MTEQIFAIVWAQFRIMRNHMPRTNFAAVAMGALTALWYAMFVGIAVGAALSIPAMPKIVLRESLPIALLGIFLYTQTIPLFTLSTGWSLQLNKLQIYPIRDISLFALEVLLRITSAPEFIIVILGGVVGLARHADVPLWAALSLLLFIPFNLFLQLAVRNFLFHAFERNRFREVITIFFVSIGVIPQLLIRTGLGVKLKPYFLLFAKGVGTPWHATASLSLGQISPLDCVSLAAWISFAYFLARRQFAKGLVQDDAFQGVSPANTGAKPDSAPFLDSISNLFRDPTAALVQKELRSLLRMPRFRVALGMACIFSLVLFVPMFLRDNDTVQHNFFPLTNLYALLLLSDALLLNIFGTDRSAAQIYFLSPVPLATVIKAKNMVAWVFVCFVNMLVAALTLLFAHLTPMNIATGFMASAVATMHLMWAGNLLSIMMPRASNPGSTMQRRGAGKTQLWIFLCTVGMAVLVGFAYLARWAFDSDWALLAVLLFEFIIGYVIYRVALDSAVSRGMAHRERIIEALSKVSSPIGGASA